MVYSPTFVFAGESGNQPASQLDTNFTGAFAGINNAFLVGTLASRPAPDGVGNGRYYFATDVQILFRDNGSAWVQVAASVLQATALRQTFRGLHLRTHPDNTVAKSQIELINLDDVVMDTGARYGSVVRAGTDAPLIADITVSGAGGLDTGSEGASFWYEPWLIGKSSTGLNSDLRLLLHRAKDYFQDQTNTTATDAQGRLRNAAAVTKLAQSITNGTAGKLEFLDVDLLRSAGLANTNVWFTIEADSAGSPSGTPLATSDKFDAGRINLTAAGFIRFPFRTPATLSAATTYWLVFQGDYTIAGGNYIQWNGTAASSYGSGQSKRFDGS